MKSTIFASRNGKELLRDPISYVFCLGLPLLMLVVMTVINSSIPQSAQMVIFNIDYLSSGIVVFSFSFVMLFAALQVSKDRTSSFLIRLYASPLKSFDFIAGYTLPLLFVALGQAMITFAASAVIAAVTGTAFHFMNVLLSIAVLIPSAFLFIGFGILFGSLLGDKSAPPVSSIIITLAGLLGGIWMDVELLGGTLKKICYLFPFYHAVKSSRAAVTGQYSDILPLLVVSGFALLVYLAAVLAFRYKMQSDVK